MCISVQISQGIYGKLMFSAFCINVIGENEEVIMQNPTHDQKSADKKPVEAAPKGAPSKYPGQKSQAQKSDSKPKNK